MRTLSNPAARYPPGPGHLTSLDRVISSYCPTARALYHSRDQIKRSIKASQTVLLASMPTTPGTPKPRDLPFATEEVAAIDSLLPSQIQRVHLEHPTKLEVLEKMGQCSVVHFACHGDAKADPSKSQILFSDWESDSFSVADMAEIKLDNVQLAYLSACHAANNRN